MQRRKIVIFALISLSWCGKREDRLTIIASSKEIARDIGMDYGLIAVAKDKF